MKREIQFSLLTWPIIDNEIKIEIKVKINIFPLHPALIYPIVMPHFIFFKFSGEFSGFFQKF